jgi:metal-responsive CopG/Arc/MetJ family transcriptional regulator
MTDTLGYIKVRFREHLRARLDAAARRRGISMNREIIRRLERSLEIQDREEDLRRAISGIPRSAV